MVKAKLVKHNVVQKVLKHEEMYKEIEQYASISAVKNKILNALVPIPQNRDTQQKFVVHLVHYMDNNQRCRALAISM